MHIAGFQTAQGSIYSFDAQGRTTRFKASPGEGQGRFHDPAMCLFIGERAVARLELEFLGPMHRVNRLALGSRDASGQFTERALAADIPAGDTPYMIVQDRLTRQVLLHGPGMVTPGLGLYPVEKSRKGGFSTVHIGNPVTALLATAGDLQTALSKMRQAEPDRPAAAPHIAKLFL